MPLPINITDVLHGYIRKASATVKAKQHDERELIGLAAAVPFDDRMNHHAKILKAIKKNGSPPPQFETDDDRTYFITIFPIHPKAKARAGKGAPERAGATPQVTAQVTAFCLVPREEIASSLRSSQ